MRFEIPIQLFPISPGEVIRAQILNIGSEQRESMRGFVAAERVLWL